MDIGGMTKLDTYTVRLPLKTPDATIPQTLASYTFNMVPVGHKGYPAPQIGTGAYKLKSFTPGQQNVHVRNPNYWRGGGEPYFHQGPIINFTNSTAHKDALLLGPNSAVTILSTSQAKVLPRP